jgi:DNA primase
MPMRKAVCKIAETLDLPGGSPISPIQGLPAPPETSRFAFLDEGTDPDDAREELAEAVSLLVERPALEAALADATARFESDPEGAFAEQQRLLRRKLEFEARLGQMASKRASRARQELDSRSADSADAAHTTD